MAKAICLAVFDLRHKWRSYTESGHRGDYLPDIALALVTAGRELMPVVCKQNSIAKFQGFGFSNFCNIGIGFILAAGFYKIAYAVHEKNVDKDDD